MLAVITRREFMCELVFALGEPAAHFLTCSACAFSNIYACNLQEVSFASVSLSLYITLHAYFIPLCMHAGVLGANVPIR